MGIHPADTNRRWLGAHGFVKQDLRCGILRCSILIPEPSTPNPAPSMTDSALPALMQAMLQPSFYPHPVQEPITLIQTHISYVFLTGDYVYKVKKPVNYGFLDFSTLEKRQHFCGEEIRLNQRGAGELYLGVLPITETADGFHLDGSGDIAEYTVKMVQFPTGQLFSDLFARNELTKVHMEQLAQVMAQFHATAQTSDYIRSFGEPAQVRIAFDENYAQTVGYIGGPQTQAQFDETKAYSDRLFDQQPELLTQRIQANKIRECHGDCHMGNIALLQENGKDKILLFDCIEFNEPFRFVDVMYDVAFAVMDLDARDRPDLGNAFLNAYVEQTGDWEGLSVLPLYLSRQAYVRGKVTSFLLNDPTIPEPVKAVATKTAGGYYTLAWRYTQAKTGQLILMSGLSGAGKSTTARHLARQHHAIHLRSDAVRKHLAGIPLTAKGGDELYTTAMTAKTYDRLLHLGTTLAAQGFTVILDAKYDRQPQRQAAITAAQQRGLPLQIIHCTAPTEVLQQRLAQRTGDISDATADRLPQQSLDPFTELEQPFVKTIDTTQELEAQL